MLNPKTNLFLNQAMVWGGISGAIISIYMLIHNASGNVNEGLQTTGFIQYIILSFGIYFCQRNYCRRVESQEDAKLGKLFLLGIVCGLAASIIIALYISYFIKVNPEVVNQAMKQSQEILKEMKMYQPEELERASEISKKIFSPALIIGNTIAYIVISAFFSAFSTLLCYLNRIKNAK